MTSRWSRCVAILVAFVFFAGAAHVPEADARSRRRKRKRKVTQRKAPKHPPGYAKAKVLFGEAVRLFDDGHYIKAVARFRAALKHYKNPRIYARIALCYKWLQNNLKALEYYERFLKEFRVDPTRAKDVRLHRKVRLEVTNLMHLVVRVRIVVPAPQGAQVRVNGVVIGRAPVDRVVRLNPGRVGVTADARGHYSFRRDLKLVPNQSVTVNVKMIKIKPKVIRIRATPIYKRWWFWTTLGALVAGGATALAITLGSSEKARMPSGTPVDHDTLRFTW